MVKKDFPRIFYDTKNKNYLATTLYSDVSNKPILAMAVLIRYYSFKKSVGSDFIVCDFSERAKAFNLINSYLYDYRDVIRIRIVNDIPSGCMLYTFPVPSLKVCKNDLSVYDVADKQISSEVIIDKTVYSLGMNKNNSLALESKKKLLLRDKELDSSPQDPIAYLSQP